MRPSREERFLSHVVAGPGGCWIWSGARNKDGYGSSTWGLAHRVSHQLFIGPIPDGHQVDHVRARGCTDKACVNPDHLEAVTPQENTQRYTRLITHCPSGHAKTEDSVHLYGNKRPCRACVLARRVASKEARSLYNKNYRTLNKEKKAAYDKARRETL